MEQNFKYLSASIRKPILIFYLLAKIYDCMVIRSILQTPFTFGPVKEFELFLMICPELF